MRVPRTVVNFLVTNIVVTVGLINAILLARWLGPAGRGEVSAALLWPTLLPALGATGMIEALVYFAAKPAADTRRILGNSILFALLLGIGSTIAGWVLAPWLLTNQDDSVIDACRVMLVSIPITLSNEMISGLLRAKMHLVAYNIQRLIIPIGYLAATIGLFQAGKLTLWGIVATQLLIYLARLIVSIGLCHTVGIKLRMTIHWPTFREMIAFGGKSHLGAIAEQGNSRLDQALIAAWLPPAQLGLYTVAVSASTILKTVSQALKITILPTLARQASMDRQNATLLRGFRVFWSITLLAAFPMAISLIWIIPALFGEAFSDAILPAMILVLGALVFGAKDVLAVAAKAMGQPWIGSKAELYAVGITVVLLAVTLPTLGIVGAAITSVIAYSASLMIVVRELAKIRCFRAENLFAPILTLSDAKALLAPSRSEQ